jgi:hypothetical protein
MSLDADTSRLLDLRHEFLLVSSPGMYLLHRDGYRAEEREGAAELRVECEVSYRCTRKQSFSSPISLLSS